MFSMAEPANETEAGNIMLNKSVLLYFAIVYSLCFLVFCGVTPDWNRLYSPSLTYRLQTESLLSGNLAIGDTVEAIAEDNTWSQGGVHQVWGLGVPLIRLPFELLSRAFGFRAFPDRVVLLLFIAAVAYAVFTTLQKICRSSTVGCTENRRGCQNRSWILAACGLLLFPPVLSLAGSRMLVYEEAVLYQYYYAIFLACLLFRIALIPRSSTIIVTGLAAGLGGLIRPTLVFYGFCAMIIGAILTLSPGFGQPKRDNRKSWKALLLGLFLYLAGNGFLFYTNLLRFGDGFEFGHRLNVQSLPGSMYSTRFDYPFEDVPFDDRAKELIGALFLLKQINGTDYYRRSFFTGQSESVRWRRFDFRTYDRSIGIMLLIAASLFVFRVSRNKGSAIARDPWCVVVGWSLMVSAILFVFYMSTPVIASRYLMDFAPAFAVLCAFPLVRAMEQMSKSRSRQAVVLMTGCWFVWQVAASVPVNAGKGGSPLEEYQSKDMGRDLNAASTASRGARRRGMHNMKSVWKISSPYDGMGWKNSGECLKPIVIVFVDDPEFVQIRITPCQEADLVPNPEIIRVKIALEELVREDVVADGAGWILKFRGPSRELYKTGLHAVFIATVPKEELASEVSAFKLDWIRWRDSSKEFSK
jgi:hypothetical protein